MAFLKAGFAPETTTIVRGKGLVLRPMVAGDFTQWAALRHESRAHLVPWEPTWSRAELSQASFRRRIRHYRREAREDKGYALAVVDEASNVMLGGVTLSNLRRGVSQAASLGYWIGGKYAGQGVMTRAVSVLIPFAFEDLCLHRLEAASMPSNSASIKVLERNNFVREGFARRLLKINGVWEDHMLFGLVADNVETAETKSK